MDSLKESLPSSAPPHADHQMHVEEDIVDQSLIDVSMTDQELIDDADAPHLCENQGRFAPNKPSEATSSPMQDDDVQPLRKEAVHSDPAAIWRRKEAPEYQIPTLHTVIAPTQAGAHQALVPGGHHHGGPQHLQHSQPVYPGHYPCYEPVNMPIPAPWHENLQYILSTYLQMAFNIAIIALVGWLALVVKNDVGKKIAERRSALIRDANWCQEQFLINNCRSGRAAPHLVENKKCLELEHCMDMDPENIRWLSMYASLLAEIMNELILPLQLRTIVFLLSGLLVIALVVGANYWFGFWRAKSYFQRTRDHPSEAYRPATKPPIEYNPRELSN